MMTPFQSEPAYAALFTLLSATQLLTNGQPNGTPAFKTYSRLAIPVSTSTPAQQPALYIMEGEIEFSPLDDMGLSTDQYKAAAIVYFTNPGGSALASPQLNALRDALIYQLRQKTLDASGNIVPLTLGDKQQLGGLCYDVVLLGRGLANEGLQNGQGAAVFPITILTGV